MIKLNTPTKIRNVISRETSNKVKYALESVVARGTGHNAFIADYRVGGKTGTAQKVKDGKYLVGNYITSFIGIFPSDQPEVVVYIAVDNAKGVTQYGGTVHALLSENKDKSSFYKRLRYILKHFEYTKVSVECKMKKLEDLRFDLTDEMNNMMILIIKQRLEEDITLKEQIALQKELKFSTSKFIKEFRKNNVE